MTGDFPWWMNPAPQPYPYPTAVPVMRSDGWPNPVGWSDFHRTSPSLSDADIDRIARRVVELLKEKSE